MSFLASTASDTLKVWQFVGAEGFKLVTSSEYPREHLASLSWNHTNQVVATAGIGRRVYLVNVSTGQMMSSLPSENDSLLGDIKSLSFSSNSRSLAAGADQLIYVWDMKTRHLTSTLQGHRGLLSAVKFFPDGRLATGDASGALRIWNVKECVSTPDLVPTTSVSSMTCLEISLTSPTRIACGYEDGGLCIWDPTSNMIQRQQILHAGVMTSVAFSPKNPKLVATGGHDGRINLVDVGSKNTGDPSASIDVGERISAISFHEDSIYAAVGSTVGNILLYDWRSVRKPVTRIPAHKPSCITSMSFQSTTGKVVSSPTKMKSSTTSLSSMTAASASATDPVVSKRRSEQSPILSTPPPASPVPLTRSVSESKQFRKPASVRATSMSAVEPEELKSQEGRGHQAGPTTRSSKASEIYIGPDKERLSQVEAGLHNFGSSDSRAKTAYSQAIVIENPNNVAEDVMKAIRPVTKQELLEELDSLRYDLHREIQAIIKEQVRQFSIAKEDTAKAIERMSAQLTEVLEANRELRAENERLRHIY